MLQMLSQTNSFQKPIIQLHGLFCTIRAVFGGKSVPMG